MKRNLFMFVALCLYCVSGYANFGGDFVAGNVGVEIFQVQNTKNVAMVYEDLEITLYPTFVKIDIQYILENMGDDVLVRAGFPVISVGELTEPYNYTIMVDNDVVPFSLSKPKQYTSIDLGAESQRYPLVTWFVSEIPFAKGEKKTVRISYLSDYRWYDFNVSFKTQVESPTFLYILSSARVWKDGVIKEGRIRINADNLSFPVTIQKPQKVFQRLSEKREWVWNFTNLKPSISSDIILTWNWKRFYIEEVWSLRGEKVDESEPLVGELMSLLGKNNFKEKIGRISFFSEEINQKELTLYMLSRVYSVEATSFLKDKNKQYFPSLLQDGDTSTAWVEGVSGNGEEEKITITLPVPAVVDSLGILPGYYKSRGLYYANARPKKIRFLLDTGEIWDVDIPDFYNAYKEMFWFPMPKKKIQKITLVILETYPGNKYQDLCISEIGIRYTLKSLISGGGR